MSDFLPSSSWLHPFTYIQILLPYVRSLDQDCVKRAQFQDPDSLLEDTCGWFSRAGECVIHLFAKSHASARSRRVSVRHALQISPAPTLAPTTYMHHLPQNPPVPSISANLSLVLYFFIITTVDSTSDTSEHLHEVDVYHTSALHDGSEHRAPRRCARVSPDGVWQALPPPAAA